MNLSICIIAKNEERFLPRLLADIEVQDYPHANAEVVLVDSGSTDSTKDLMLAFAASSDYAAVKVLDNPKGIQAAGWNVAISHASGDVISRIDAHSSLSSNFFSLAMRDIESGEDIVGGKRPCKSESDDGWSRLLLAVENSLFGSNINASRRSESKRYVDTMFHASYRREVFQKVGLFNEGLLRTEDNELHYRMREAGYRFFYDPEIVSYQYVRNSFTKMLRQKYGNGYWIGVTLKVCPKCISPYHLVPMCFVVALVIASVFTAMGVWLPFALIGIAYACFAILSALSAVFTGQVGVLAGLMPFMFLVLHIGYGAGSVVGLCIGRPREDRQAADSFRKQDESGMGEGGVA